MRTPTRSLGHGDRQDRDEPVSLTFEIQNGRIALTYEDTAPLYDPFSAVRVPPDPVGAGEGSEGGLGVVLSANIAKEIEYSYSHGRNRIVVGVGRQSA